MEFKGTTGTWKVQSDGFLTTDAVKDVYAIAKVFTNPHMNEHEAEANKKVIACAPELLEALKECLEFDGDGMNTVREDKYKELIKRATE